MAKNCHSCKHLSYEHGDYETQTPGGWECNKREPVTIAAETQLIKNMQAEPYRNRYKRCFEPVATKET
jgi:hypothetical protein